ncbi:hypothetical protein FH972_008816 [Carpinus fangiana]|uniref:CBS domain-containing protein n=1 Tax=Carpinus fangiana TaxID=176857 RepID=A0A5N6R3A2_9ROSI|nr:hypothetical protein FH972_008816 [Carpinus fangiana]
MYLVESKGGAILCMLLALLFFSTWPAVMTLLERRGRLPQHTYLDYSITNLLAAVIIALTFGEIGSEVPNFFTQLAQFCCLGTMSCLLKGLNLDISSTSSFECSEIIDTAYLAMNLVSMALYQIQLIHDSARMLGGPLFCLPWRVEWCSALVIYLHSTTTNYFLDDKINKAEILFPGVGCFLIAVCLASAVHTSNAADNKEKLNSLSSDIAGTEQLPTNLEGQKTHYFSGGAFPPSGFGPASSTLSFSSILPINVCMSLIITSDAIGGPRSRGFDFTSKSLRVISSNTFRDILDDFGTIREDYGSLVFGCLVRVLWVLEKQNSFVGILTASDLTRRYLGPPMASEGMIKDMHRLMGMMDEKLDVRLAGPKPD